MKLKDLVNLIKHISLSQPDVHSFYEGDVYKAMNANAAIDYASVVLTYNNFTHNEDDESTTYNMYLFYVDREVSDDSNQLDVQSHSIDVLKSIIHTIENYDVIVNQSIYHPFKERFGDECSGAYAEIALTVIDGECDNFFVDIDEAAKEEIKRLEAQVSSLKRQVNNLQKDIDDMTDLEVTENGIYNPEGIGYKKVSVDVQGVLKYERDTVLWLDVKGNVIFRRKAVNNEVNMDVSVDNAFYTTVGSGITTLKNVNRLQSKMLYLGDDVIDISGNGKDVGSGKLIAVFGGNSLHKLGDYTFFYCINLVYFENLKNISEFGKSALLGCINLNSEEEGHISLGTVTKIEEGAFEDVDFTSFDIDGDNAWIDDNWMSSHFYIDDENHYGRPMGRLSITGSFYNLPLHYITSLAGWTWNNILVKLDDVQGADERVISLNKKYEGKVDIDMLNSKGYEVVFV